VLHPGVRYTKRYIIGCIGFLDSSAVDTVPHFCFDFGFKRNSILGSDEIDFDFDFRYYTPYSTGGLTPGGLYVFKTTDNNSIPYNHKIKQIKIFAGAKMQMFVISYV
jgi:hypothetical protein